MKRPRPWLKWLLGAFFPIFFGCSNQLVQNVSYFDCYAKLIGKADFLLNGEFFLYYNEQQGFFIDFLELPDETKISVLPKNAVVRIERVVRESCTPLINRNVTLVEDIPVVSLQNPKDNQIILAKVRFCYLRKTKSFHKVDTIFK